MAKKKIIKRNIPKNLFWDGGMPALPSGPVGGNIVSQANIINPSAAGVKLTSPVPALGANPSSGGMMPGLGGIANIGATAIGGLINPSGNTTGVGSAMQTVGSLASNIPGVGGIIGAGVNMLGGLANAAFGSKINNAFVDQTQQGAKTQAGYTSGATTNDQLMSDWSGFNNLSNVTKSQVGSDGWFSNKAKRKTEELNRKIGEANTRALYSLDNTASNIGKQSGFNLLANYAAFGGPLSSGAIDYDFNNRYLDNGLISALAKNKLTALPNSFEGIDEMNTFAKGGGIHIKKANRGKFTEYCGGKVTNECIARGKKSKSPAVRKRATFAQNARGWSHAEGGWLNTQGGDFTNGVTFIDNGGTHEQNPYDGVQMGIDPQGVPNLVEEGEVMFNNYVYSNRLKVPKNVKKQYKLKGNTFADAAKEIQKESEERPNDPISMNALNVGMGRLAENQEELKAKKERRSSNTFAEGGPYKTYKNFDNINNDWYTDEYMNFVNSLKEGDTNSLNWLNRINEGEFGTIGGNNFTDISDIRRLATDRKKGPVHNAMLAASKAYKNESTPTTVDTSKLSTTTPISPKEQPNTVGSQRADNTGGANVPPTGNFSNKYGKRPAWLRYAPVVGAGLGVVSDLFGGGPDYSEADAVASSVGNLSNVEFNPVGNYLSYNPLDRDFYLNRAGQQAGATRRALLDTSGGNRAQAQAGLLAADYNYGQNLGNFARQAEEYNQQQRERVEGFNRATNMFNSEGAMKAAIANKQNEELRFRGATTAAQMRQGIRAIDEARKSANMTSLFQGLGDIGWEQEQAKWIDNLSKSGVLKMDLQGRYTGNRSANGGKIKTKKKKGYTYG